LLTFLLLALVAVIGGEWVTLLRDVPTASAGERVQKVVREAPEIASHEVSMLGAALVHRGTAAARRAHALEAPLLPMSRAVLDARPAPAELCLGVSAESFFRPPPRAFSPPLLI
jgi:hypothetical protein